MTPALEHGLVNDLDVAAKQVNKDGKELLTVSMNKASVAHMFSPLENRQHMIKAIC